MSEYYTIITNLGLAQIATAVSNNSLVNIAKIGVGDSGGNPYDPTAEQTELVNQQWIGDVTNIEVDAENSNWIKIETIIPSSVGGWNVNEAGLYDNAGNLLAVAKLASAYKPIISEGTTRDMRIQIIIEITNPEVVDMTIDPNVIIATRQWVSDNYAINVILPGGETGNVLAKKSNQDGDTVWIDPLTGYNLVVETLEETQTLTASQSIVKLLFATTSNFAIYIDGRRLHPDEYSINSSTQFTLSTPATGGEKILIVQNDAASPSKYLKSTDDLSDLENPEQARKNLGLEETSYQESIVRLLLDEQYSPSKGNGILITRRTGNPNTWGGAWDPLWGWERDFIGRAIVGYDEADSNFNKLDNQVGASDHTLKETEMPSHTHGYNYENTRGFGELGAEDGGSSFSTEKTEQAGGDQPHNNIQKSQVIYIWQRTS